MEHLEEFQHWLFWMRVHFKEEFWELLEKSPELIVFKQSD